MEIYSHLGEEKNKNIERRNFGPGDTKKNLKLAIEGETFEIDEMYPVYRYTKYADIL